jgi:hypothetical protein
MNADGTNQTNLTNTPAISERGPIWSPDNWDRLRRDDNIFSSVWVMNADGTGQARISTFEETNLTHVVGRRNQDCPRSTSLNQHYQPVRYFWSRWTVLPT